MWVWSNPALQNQDAQHATLLLQTLFCRQARMASKWTQGTQLGINSSVKAFAEENCYQVVLCGSAHSYSLQFKNGSQSSSPQLLQGAVRMYKVRNWIYTEQTPLFQWDKNHSLQKKVVLWSPQAFFFSFKAYRTSSTSGHPLALGKVCFADDGCGKY